MPAATAVDRAPDCTSDDAPPAECTCGVDVAGLRLPGLAELRACPEGCVEEVALAALLAAIDPAELMTDVEVLDLVAAWSRVTAWSQARGLRAVAEFARRPESGPGSEPLVARARRHRPGGGRPLAHRGRAGGRAVGLAGGCRAPAGHGLPVGPAVPGHVAGAGVRPGGRGQAGGDDHLRRRVPGPGAGRGRGRVLVGGDHGFTAGFGREVRRQAARLDPEGTSARAAERRADRFVRTRPAQTQDTMWLGGVAPAEHAAAVRTVIEAAARTMRGREGEDRTMHQLRATALVATFWSALASGALTTPDGPLPLAGASGTTAAVTMTVGADGVADLHGYGPISASSAREVAARVRSGRWPVVRVVRGFDDDAARSAAGWTAEPGYRPSAEGDPRQQSD